MPWGFFPRGTGRGRGALLLCRRFLFGQCLCGHGFPPWWSTRASNYSHSAWPGTAWFRKSSGAKRQKACRFQVGSLFLGSLGEVHGLREPRGERQTQRRSRLRRGIAIMRVCFVENGKRDGNDLRCRGKRGDSGYADGCRRRQGPVFCMERPQSRGTQGLSRNVSGSGYSQGWGGGEDYADEDRPQVRDGNMVISAAAVREPPGTTSSKQTAVWRHGTMQKKGGGERHGPRPLRNDRTCYSTISFRRSLLLLENEHIR